MVNLAFADLNLGLVVVPLSAIYHVSEGLKSPLHDKIGNYLYFPYFTACTASFLRLIILTTDRFVAVTYLIAFVTWLDGMRSLATSAAVWTVLVAMSLIYFTVGLNIYRVFANKATVVRFAVLLFTHLKVVRSFRLQVLQWDHLHNTSKENTAKK